jgi:hypothetical protein
MSTIKTERVRDTLEQYVRPRMRRGVDFNAAPLFVGVNDQNVAAHIDDILGGAIRLTTGDLAHDANVPELKRKLKQAIGDNSESKPSTTKRAPNNSQAPQESEFEAKVAKVLALLEHKLLPTELMAVRELLLSPSTKSRHPDGTEAIKPDYAEDARIAFNRRYPDAKRIVVEPNIKPETQPVTASDPSAFFARFPDAKRIGLA